MKKVGFICVYNDIDYIEQTILSVKDWVDELIIVEGAFEITMKCGMPPRSNDGTLDIINKYVDNQKIFLKQVNLREHKDHYQVGLDFAKERNADWAILIDSDEIWIDTTKRIANFSMSKALREGNVYEFRIDEYCFINDFWTWYPGQYPRIFRVTPQAKFIADNEVEWPDHNKHADRGRAENHIQNLSLVFKNYHYGYVRTKNRWKLKQDYMKVKDGNPINDQYTLEDNSYKIPSDIPIFKFIGQHPEIMQKHPFMLMSSKEIIHGEK